jgi:integral membrane protein
MLKKFTTSYQKFKPFKDDEAWALFKIAAIAEACGWTLLITGILIQKFILPHSKIPVLITGQIHGTIFLIYIAAPIILAPSMGWSSRKALIAALCGVPPYGSLIFELWADRERQKTNLKNLSYSMFYHYLLKTL